MFDLQLFKELLPKKLQCKKDSRYEEIADYHYNVFLGYDENNQVYTITRDENGYLHVVERHFEEEQRAKYAAINSIGKNMTLSSDPTFATKHQNETIRSTSTRKEIVLVPAKDKLKRGYTSITISFGNETYSIINNNGNIKLLKNGEDIEIDSTEKTGFLDFLKKPFDVSIIDKLKMRSIAYTGNDRLHHIEQTNQYKSVFIPITPERMREWDEAEK